eukprot:scaffold113238_cov52-Prasinocladus_malaysianus.AAC.1
MAFVTAGLTTLRGGLSRSCSAAPSAAARADGDGKASLIPDTSEVSELRRRLRDLPGGRKLASAGVSAWAASSLPIGSFSSLAASMTAASCWLGVSGVSSLARLVAERSARSRPLSRFALRISSS